MHRYFILILLFLFMSTFLTGCLGSAEINDLSYVYTIGLDKGVSNLLRFTIQIPTMQGQSNSNSSSEISKGGDYTYISMDVPTAFAGANMINTALSRNINFMHLKIFIISEEVAKEGIEEILNAFVRYGQIRRIASLVVVKGSASDFIKKNELVVGKSLPKMQEDVVNEDANINLYSNVTLGDLLNQMKNRSEQYYIPLAAINDYSNFKEGGENTGTFKMPGDYYAGELPRSGGDKTEYLGSAIFDGDKMVGVLNGEETQMMLMARGEFQRTFMPISDPLEPEKPDTIDVRQQKKPEIHITLSGDKPVVDLKLFLEGDLIALRSTTNYESVAQKPLLEKKVEEYIKGKLDMTIEKCKSCNSDVFRFGKKAVTYFPTIQQWEGYNWLKRFKDAEINTSVQFVIRRTGTMLKTNPSVSTEETP